MRARCASVRRWTGAKVGTALAGGRRGVDHRGDGRAVDRSGGRSMGSQAAVLTFLGAAGTVTGSKTLVETRSARILVDCGLFQGPKALRLQNWEALPVAAEAIDAVVLTHAHLDHCGYLPRLVRSGFRGPVVCTPGTARLAGIVLTDSGRLQEEEADYANRMGYSKHDPAEPLYTEAEAIASLARFETVAFATPHEVAPGVHVTFRR